MGVTAQDKKIAGMIQEARKPCVVAVNKWDLVKDKTEDKDALNEFLADLRAELFFLDYAPVLLASAKTGAEMTRIFKTIERIKREAQERIGTGPLNRLISTATTAHPAPMQSGRRFKILYGTLAATRTRSPIPIPEIVLFCNDEKLLIESYRRYLESRIRESWPCTGLPLLFHLRPREVKGSAKQAARGRKGGDRPAAAPRPDAPTRKKRNSYPEGKKRPARGVTGKRQGG